MHTPPVIAASRSYKQTASGTLPSRLHSSTLFNIQLAKDLNPLAVQICRVPTRVPRGTN